MFYVPIAGTWGRERACANRSPSDPLHWFMRGSDVDRVMVAHGHERVDQDRDPNTPDNGFWSGDIGGTLTQRLWPWSDHLNTWRDGGAQFSDFCFKRQDEFQDGLVVLTHSHGGHVLAMALFMSDLFSFPIYVIDIDMPVQRGFRVDPMLYTVALKSVKSWTHVFSGRGLGSKFRWLGNAFNTRRLDYGAQKHRTRDRRAQRYPQRRRRRPHRPVERDYSRERSRETPSPHIGAPAAGDHRLHRDASAGRGRSPGRRCGLHAGRRDVARGGGAPCRGRRDARD